MHDSHVHIAMSPLKENIEVDIQEFIQQNGKKILTQTTDITDYRETIDLANHLNRKFPNVIALALGIHPSRFDVALSKNTFQDTDIFKYAKKQLDLFQEIFEKNINNINAIGECGLDYFGIYEYNNFTDEQIEQLKEVQRRVFTKLCELALKNNLPMSIHSRGVENNNECTQDALSIIAKVGKGSIRGSFHSYTGNSNMIEKILGLGMYIGFNAIITYPSGSNVRYILKNTPLDRILFETDGPYLPTQSVRKNKKAEKKYGRPVLIEEIIEQASKIKEIPYKQLEDFTDKNYLTLFSK